MNKKTEKKIDDELDPKARGRQTRKVDFDRNRDGLYGGLPEVRDNSAGPPQPQPRGN